jgi:hypothetical protein
MFDNRLTRAILDGRFEETDNGVFIPSMRLLIEGMWMVGKRGEEMELVPNMVVTEGRNYLLATGLTGGSANANWYIAPFSGDVTVVSTWTAANFTASATEVTAYAAAARPAWTPGAVATGTVNSFASKASFAATSNGVVIRGAGMISASGKSATTGTLLAAAKFTTAKTLDTDEILDVGYGITLSVPA